MFTTPRPYLLGALAALMVAGCGDAPTDVLKPLDPSSSLIASEASFDWTVPARFGFDRNGDGLTDYPRTPEEINPSSWPVDFDACALGGDRFDWFVDNRRVASVTTCHYRHEFAALGTYDVQLHVVSESGPTLRVGQVVTVQDWLIVSFGDSYASGEGVPEIPMANPALIRSIESLFADLAAARQHRQAAQDNLAEAIEAKGLWDDILALRRQRRTEFRDACTNMEGWSDVKACADFLRDRGLSFTLYNDAVKHFDDLVNNAAERVQSLAAALTEAQNAFNAAQNAVANVREALDGARDGFTEARWQAPYPDEDLDDCHRSANAAPARAALALEQSDPRTSVTFVHLACTGAQITSGTGQLEGHQIPLAKSLLGDREIDAVLVSIGGNDAGFANFALACAVQEHCFDDAPQINPAQWTNLCLLLDLVGLGEGCRDAIDELPEESAKQLLEAGIAKLEGRYAVFAEELLGLTGLLEPETGGPGRDGRGRPGLSLAAEDRVRSSRVYLTEYVDMTRGSNGQYCVFDPANILGTMPGFSVPEKQWLDVTAAQGINQAVRSAAETHGWSFVTGIYSAYATHGYCAEAPWVVRGHETFLIQGGPKGMAHPNVAGHEHNGQAIWASLMADLYPDGLSGTPRAPDQAPGPGVFAGGRR